MIFTVLAAGSVNETNDTDNKEHSDNGVNAKGFVLLLEGKSSPGVKVLRPNGRRCRLRRAIPPLPHFYGSPGK